jgi:myo-inositol-1(or 4)-monophosphatase
VEQREKTCSFSLVVDDEVIYLRIEKGIDMSEELKAAETAAKKAGEIILSMTGKANVEEKGQNYNLVTEADTAAEKMVLSYLGEQYPDDVLLGEESTGEKKLTGARLWIVDPLDGTTNYAHGIPHCAVSIAFACEGTVQCGVVFNPVSGELFSAQRGRGALCNGNRISVSSASELSKAVIATGFYYERGPLMERTLDSLRLLYKANIRGMRRMGSAALDLCYVACGRFDAYFEYRLSPWDFAAGMLLVTEAGGTFRGSDGSDSGLLSKGVVCSNGHLHDEFSEIVLR